VVQRVVVHPDRIELELGRSELLAALTGRPRASARRDRLDIIRLAVEARIKRCGGETRLVVPPHLPGYFQKRIQAQLPAPT
jgi:hypothetical protein